ncbi:MAG: hypothetical protein QM764_02900 [Chitinophagaceae bacterium]
MNEDFFWSPNDEAGPFGSDSGADAAHGFSQWRKTNATANPINYLSDLLVRWNLPLFDWNELDPEKVAEFIKIKANTDNIFQQVEQLKQSLKNSPGFDDNISDESIQDLILKSAEGMGGIYLLQMDNAIIGTGFAQFAMEGKIDSDLHYLTHTALRRQLLPILIERYSEEHKANRKEVLNKMIKVIELANQ